jgi:hypothetical protein
MARARSSRGGGALRLALLAGAAAAGAGAGAPPAVRLWSALATLDEPEVRCERASAHGVPWPTVR